MLRELKITDAQLEIVWHMNDFRDSETCGLCYNQGGVDAANGPIASVCSAEPLEDESDGYGTPRITSGPRCIQSSKRDGSMLMRARKRGISHGSTLKVSKATPPVQALNRLI